MLRGNGKTLLAPGARRLREFVDGVEGAEVALVASDERQARITLRKVLRMSN